MRDQSFTKDSLTRMIRNHDYAVIRNLKTMQAQYVDQAYQRALVSRGAIGVSLSTLRKKAVYNINNFPDELLIRKITQNVRRVTKAKQQNRDKIINNLKKLLEEGVKCRVYRLDIRDFYGSVDVVRLVGQLKADWNISRPTVEFIDNILNQFLGNGLPRGLSLSATLAEYVMQPFDAFIDNHQEVYFYSRFVDDIIIITSGDENEPAFLHDIREKLAVLGLRLNTKKSKRSIHLVPSSYRGTPKEFLHGFSFLGYAFKIYNRGKANLSHEVEIDIAPEKIKKIKTKLVNAFLDFLDQGGFSLLEDRVRLLTGNYYVRDRRNLAKRTAGIFYSYRHVNMPTDQACAVRLLDAFLRNMILSNNGKVSTKLNLQLNEAQKKKLLKRSFIQGQKNKKFHHFSPTRLGQIMECWRYD